MIFLRVMANVIIMILLALSTYVIQLFVERSRQLELAKLADKSLKVGFWAENEVTRKRLYMYLWLELMYFLFTRIPGD